MKKVNLGSGTSCLSNWINIDNAFNARMAKHPRLSYILYKMKIFSGAFYEILLSWSENIESIIVRDVRKRLPFDSETINFVYSSHLIEHLEKHEAENLLRECFRVLKKGGLIRLVTPDLEILTKTYIKEIEERQKDDIGNNSLPSEEFLGILGIYNRDPGIIVPLAAVRERGFLGILGTYIYRIPFFAKVFAKIFYTRHKWIYDQFSLRALLMTCGFTHIQKKSYKIGEMPDIAFLDRRPEESLYMEAQKMDKR
jgi:SAM-dependent methyltransferase